GRGGARRGRQRVGPSRERGRGGGVGPRGGEPAQHRVDVNDRAAPVGGEYRRESADQQQRPEDVGLVGGADLLDRRGEQRGGAVDAGGVFVAAVGAAGGRGGAGDVDAAQEGDDPRVGPVVLAAGACVHLAGAAGEGLGDELLAESAGG